MVQWKCYLGVNGNETYANKIARNIDYIFQDISTTDEHSTDKEKINEIKQKWNLSASTYNQCTGTKYTADDAKVLFDKKDTTTGGGRDRYEAACICYEYMQFKKSIFRCQKSETDTSSGITYDTVTGREKITYKRRWELLLS